MQRGRLVCYHSKVFHGAVLNHYTYDKAFYALMQAMKKWKHYLMGNEIVIHTDHQPLQYLHTKVSYNKQDITSG